jgi:curved DNA-binding protein CbpA
MPHASEVDHYRVLGVTPAASTHEIRRAYRRLARQYHPDHSPQSAGAERFTALARAYAILNDPAGRADYDRTLRRSVTPDRRPVTPRTGAGQQTIRRGILELSPVEARQLARHPLTLTDPRGQTLVLPAGAGPGDAIILLYGGDLVLLTIAGQRKT